MNSEGSSSSSTKMDYDTDVFVDETYFSALFDYEEVLPVSDENYATELCLQEALYSSLLASTGRVYHHSQAPMNLATRIKQEPGIMIMTAIKQEPGVITAEGSSGSSTRLCMICMDEKPSSDIFRGTLNCTHFYCTQCTVRYVATKIKENAPRIKCPDVECTQLIEPYTCCDLIPKDVFERREKILCESLISSWDKVYCPFKDCSAMMVKDEGLDANVTQTECPSCHRLFCMRCEVTWHAGIGCEEFKKYGNSKKKSDEEDALLVQMAKNKKWRRCPRCKFYVDKVDGCLHISAGVDLSFAMDVVLRGVLLTFASDLLMSFFIGFDFLAINFY